MTPVGAIHAIASRVEDAWAGTAVGRVVFPGQRAEPGVDDPDAAWIRLTIKGLPPKSSTHGAVGERLVEQRSLLIAQVFCPNATEDGSIAAMELATAFRDLFHGQSLGPDPLHFETAAPSFIGADGPWSQANVSIPFTYHERV